MGIKNKKFADDGWAVWIGGDDVSTVYINNWINPKGDSYVDFAIRIRGIQKARDLNIYVPFIIEREEIEDLSYHLNNPNTFRVTFNNVGMMDYMKNEYTSEAAYNGKTIDIIHYPISMYDVNQMTKGTLIRCDIEKIKKYIDNDEAYFFLRFPHKSMNAVFKSHRNVRTLVARLRDLIMSPVVTDSYVYQIRINEARVLPQEINKIGSFHRQRLKKAVVSISVAEEYEVNDHNCYRVRRVVEEAYQDFVPKGFNLEDAINYLWQEDKDNNYQGRFNFYLHISRSKIGKASMFIYLILLVLTGVLGSASWDLIKNIFSILQ